nr:MAG TPA_asm: hypothetical protein [Caudoviricetes sp.]
MENEKSPEQQGGDEALKAKVKNMFLEHQLTYGEVKHILFSILNEYKRKEEKHLNSCPIQVLDKLSD